MLNHWQARVSDVVGMFRKRASRRSSRRGVSSPESLEIRALLVTNLNLIDAAGVVNDRISLTGGNEVNNYDISYNAGTGIYRIEDTTGTAINVIGGLTGLDTNASASIVEFSAAAAEAVTNFVSIQVNAGGGDDSITINSIRSGDEGISVTDAAGTDTLTINGNIGTAGSRVTGSNVVLRAENVNLQGGIFATGVAVTIGGTATATLTGSFEVDSTGATVTFENALNGAQSLKVTGGTLFINGSVGNVTPLTNLELTGSALVRTQVVTVNTGNLIVQADTYQPQNTVSGTANLVLRRNTAGTQSFNADYAPLNSGNWSSVTLGSALTTTLTIASDGDPSVATGSMSVFGNLNLVGLNILVQDSIQQGANQVTFIAENNLTFSTGVGAAVGTGNVNVNKLTPGGTLTVNGRLGGGTRPWGNNAVFVNAVGSTVLFNDAVGSTMTSLTAVADNLIFDGAAAVTAQGNVTLIANTITLDAGAFSVTGDVLIQGNLILAGNNLLRVSAGQDITVTGTVTANGRNIIVRSSVGAINQVSFNGDITGAGSFQIDSSGANTAANVSLAGVSATNILVRAANIEVQGDLTSGGNVQLVGAIDITGTRTITSGGLATNSVRFDGLLESNTAGTDTLIVQAGLGTVVFGQDVGGVRALSSLAVNASANNTLSRNITVENNFLWNNGAGRLLLSTGKTVTSNNGDITIFAGVFDKRGNLFAPNGVISTP
jgi:hypothetical protein